LLCKEAGMMEYRLSSDYLGGDTMIEGLSDAQLEAILDTLPMNFIFVDENERLVYRNKAGGGGAQGAPDIMGKDIRGCHKESSLPRLEQMVLDFKSRKKDEDEFWMMVPERRLLNRFLAVRDKSGNYLGMIEYVLDFTAMDELAEAKKDSYKRWPDDKPNA
jgi:uncharacterized protein